MLDILQKAFNDIPHEQTTRFCIKDLDPNRPWPPHGQELRQKSLQLDLLAMNVAMKTIMQWQVAPAPCWDPMIRGRPWMTPFNSPDSFCLLF